MNTAPPEAGRTAFGRRVPNERLAHHAGIAGIDVVRGQHDGCWRTSGYRAHPHSVRVVERVPRQMEDHLRQAVWFPFPASVTIRTTVH